MVAAGTQVDKVEIEGSVIRHIRTTVMSEAPLSEVQPRLVTRLATVFPVLPSAAPTRYLEFDPNTGRGILITEQAPQLRRIRVRHTRGRDAVYRDDAAREADSDGASAWNVMFPYTYFVFPFRMTEQTAGRLSSFTIDGTMLLFRRDPFRSQEDTFWNARTPNVDNGGGICWGGTLSPQPSFSAHIDYMINTFYTSTFNQDLGHHTPFNNSLTEWEAHSGPLDYLTWPMWDGPGAQNINAIRAYLVGGQPVPNIAELNPAFVALPELPQNFTVLRAQQWLNSLPEGARRRFVVALSTTPEASDG